MRGSTSLAKRISERNGLRVKVDRSFVALFRTERGIFAIDDACPHRDDDALVYLYLRNRTPVNRHLIRSGLVEVDTTRDYRFKKAFLAERGR